MLSFFLIISFYISRDKVVKGIIRSPYFHLLVCWLLEGEQSPVTKVPTMMLCPWVQRHGLEPLKIHIKIVMSSSQLVYPGVCHNYNRMNNKLPLLLLRSQPPAQTVCRPPDKTTHKNPTAEPVTTHASQEVTPNTPSQPPTGTLIYTPV